MNAKPSRDRIIMAHRRHKWNHELVTGSYKCATCYAMVTHQQVDGKPTYKDLDRTWKDYKTIGVNGLRLIISDPENTEPFLWMVEIVETQKRL